MKKDQKTVADMEDRLRNSDPVSPQSARDYLTAIGKPSQDDRVNEAWAKIQQEIKNAVLNGAAQTTVSTAGHYSPSFKKAIADRLTKAGFEYDVLGLDLTIFW